MSSSDTSVMDISMTRDDVATFAMWCVGSCHGDHAPCVDAERERVMTDDCAFAEWRAEYMRYLSAKATGEPFAGTDMGACSRHDADHAAA